MSARPRLLHAFREIALALFLLGVSEDELRAELAAVIAEMDEVVAD